MRCPSMRFLGVIRCLKRIPDKGLKGTLFVALRRATGFRREKVLPRLARGST